VALVLGDALAMVLLDERGFTEDDFAKYHPGGSLGKVLLTRVKDIMRTGEALALCNLNNTVMEAIQLMSVSRSGACFVLNPDETLAGVFSHGDFARSYQKDPGVGEKLVKDFMTVNPVTVYAQALAVEAVKLTQVNRIDDLPVVGNKGEVLGVVDTQDFARLKLV